MNEAFPDLPALAALGDALTASFQAAERTAASQPAFRARFRSRGRPTLLFAALALMLAVTGALAATHVIRIGAPAKPGPAFSHPHRGAGAIVPHSVRLLGVKTADPIDGPPWGMRVLNTTRGVGCIQVGRLFDGKLGLLGTAGAFQNDGLFHAMPANSSFGPADCTTLDRNGRIFLAVHIDYMPASAIQSCYVLRFSHGGQTPSPACKPADERTLDYGLLGPDAKSITYRTAAGERTRPTVGPEGAYLLVRQALQQGRSDAAGAGLLPAYGAIAAVTYRDGSTCHLPLHGRPYPASACKAQGYAQKKTTIPTPQEVRAPVHARVVRSRRRGRHRLIEVTFTARVPVTDARGNYTVSWHLGRPRQTRYELGTQGDIHAGQTIRRRLMVQKPGTYYGEVTYNLSRGPDPGFPLPSTRTSRLVGTFHVVVE